MALTKLTKDMDIIQKLGDEPNDVYGLSSAELKAKFDEGNNAMKQWVNETFITEVEKEIKASRLENLPEHAHTHAKDGRDPVTPADIGFDHSAKEIDNAVDKANNAVSNAGGRITGILEIRVSQKSPLELNRVSASASSVNIKYLLNGETIGEIGVYRNTGPIFTGTDGVAQTILHAGNKPSGSYTGNGDATARYLSIDGAIGGAVLITSDHGSALLTLKGALHWSGQAGVQVLSSAEARVDGHIMLIATTNDRLNANGITYTYQFL